MESVCCHRRAKTSLLEEVSHGKPILPQKTTLWIEIIRDLKKGRRYQHRERQLKMWLRVSAIVSQLFQVLMLAKFAKVSWNLIGMSSLQSRSFHVVERTRMAAKCTKKMRIARAKILSFVVKYANLSAKYADILMLSTEIPERNNRARPLYYTSLKWAFTVVCVYWYPSTFTTGTMIHSNVTTKCVIILSWV